MKRTRKRVLRVQSRRPKSARRGFYDLKKNCLDPILKKNYKNDKTLIQNKQLVDLKQHLHLLADDLQLRTPSPHKRLNEMETKIISKLVEKYKEDYV
ncbi:hypothetical protein, conserved, partial [Eimeria tenella]